MNKIDINTLIKQLETMRSAGFKDIEVSVTDGYYAYDGEINFYETEKSDGSLVLEMDVVSTEVFPIDPNDQPVGITYSGE